MIHFDAHADTWEGFFDQQYFHGSPFRCALEENILLGDKIYQIGLRGGLTGDEDYCFALENGVRMVSIDDVKQKGGEAVVG